MNSINGVTMPSGKKWDSISVTKDVKFKLDLIKQLLKEKTDSKNITYNEVIRYLCDFFLNAYYYSE